MKNATYRHFGWKTAGWIFLLMLICAILCGSAWAENEIQISAAERQYMENGIDLILSNVPESGDFAVSVRSPMHIVELIESWNFEIRVARENGEFSFSLETGGVVSFSYLTYPYPVGLSSASNENGDLLLHIDLEEDSISLAGTEWPMEMVVWEEEFRSHRKGRTVGSFVLLRYPEGISAPVRRAKNAAARKKNPGLGFLSRNAGHFHACFFTRPWKRRTMMFLTRENRLFSVQYMVRPAGEEYRKTRKTRAIT